MNVIGKRENTIFRYQEEQNGTGHAVQIALKEIDKKKFNGTVMLVSHDRHFLRSLVNRVFEIDHGEMRICEGDYSYYLEKSRQEKTG